MEEIENSNHIDLIRERFEKLLQVPAETRDKRDLFQLMRLSSNFAIFSELKMTKMHEDICQLLKLKDFENGEVLFKQGDEGDCYYFILNGCIDLYTLDIDSDTGKTILKHLKNCLPGDGFGELSILYDCPRSFTAICSMNSSLIYISKKNYRKYVKDFHEKQLFELIKFFYSIPIFKDQSMKSIIKLCLKSQNKKLNSYVPFVKYHDYINDYIIIKTGVIKAFYKIKVTKNFMKNAHLLEEDDFIYKLEQLQRCELNKEIEYTHIEKKNPSYYDFKNNFKSSLIELIKNPYKFSQVNEEKSVATSAQKDHHPDLASEETNKASKKTKLNFMKNLILNSRSGHPKISEMNIANNNENQTINDNQNITSTQQFKSADDSKQQNQADQAINEYVANINLFDEGETNFTPQLTKGSHKQQKVVKYNPEIKAEIEKNELFEKNNLIADEKSVELMGKDLIYNEIIEIMDFNEKDMVCEYYACKSQKIDVYLLPTLPTEVITIKTDEFKEIAPDLSNAIREYSRPVFEAKRVYKKLHKTLKWKTEKQDLLSNALNK